MVNLVFQFPYSCLCLLKQLLDRTRMMMGFWWECNKVFQAVIIPNSIYMVDLPPCGSRTMGIFPNNNVLKYLMPNTSTWMVSAGKKNIAITVFNSATFPIRIVFTLPILIMAFATLLRVPVHPATAARTNFTVPLGIFIGIATPFSLLLFSSHRHEYIIADEIQLSNKLMRQKPDGRMGR